MQTEKRKFRLEMAKFRSAQDLEKHQFHKKRRTDRQDLKTFFQAAFYQSENKDLYEETLQKNLLNFDLEQSMALQKLLKRHEVQIQHLEVSAIEFYENRYPGMDGSKIIFD